MKASGFFFLAVTTVLACGGNGTVGFDDGGTGGDGNVDDVTIGDENPIIVTDGAQEAAPPCKNLQCQIVNCGGGVTTTISGTVYTPAATNPDPVYNAIVYVPNAPVAPLSTGATCDQCGAPVSGEPVAIALTGADGKFVLKNVPSGTNIPLVVQIGKWRRQITIPSVQQCVDNKATAAQTRLPRNHNEGDMPQMAIVTSVYDNTECILRKMGVDDSEFTNESGTGRIHIYHGNGATLSTPTSAGTALWSSLATLKKYDLVALPCSSYPVGNYQPTFDYANAGGRLYITDLSYPTIQSGPAPWPSTANWGSSSGANPASIDTSFPKGAALADWLQNIGATTVKGQLNLTGNYFRFTTSNKPAQRWVYFNQNAEQLYGFNTPYNDPPNKQCGRVFYASFHVANNGSGVFPAECSAQPLTAQEKALEFMLLDLSSCVTDDTKPPPPPPGPN